MNGINTPSTDESHLADVTEELLVEVDATTTLLFYFSIEELAELTPGELHLLAALNVETDDQTQDMHAVGTAKEYEDRIRERVTKTRLLPNRTGSTRYEHVTYPRATSKHRCS